MIAPYRRLHHQRAWLLFCIPAAVLILERFRHFFFVIFWTLLDFAFESLAFQATAMDLLFELGLINLSRSELRHSSESFELLLILFNLMSAGACILGWLHH